MKTSRELTQLKHYEAYAWKYDRKITRRGSRNLNIKTDVISSFLAFDHNAKILCVGCGTGIDMINLCRKKEAAPMIGVDISFEMLKIFSNKLKEKNDRLKLINADVYALPFKSHSFDGVFGVDILHHVDTPVNFIKEMLRILKRGCRFSIIETNPYHPYNLIHCFDKLEKRIFRSTKSNLKRWFEAAGADAVEIGNMPLYFPPFPEIAHNLYARLEKTLARINGIKNLSTMLYANGTKTAEPI